VRWFPATAELPALRMTGIEKKDYSELMERLVSLK
jgi:hypothetical protein